MAGSGLQEFNLDASVARMKRIMIVLAAVGSVALFIAKGPPWGVGFLFGAAVSLVSFHYTHRFVMAIGAPGSPKPRTWKSVLFGSRYLVMGGVAWAAVSAFGLNVVAALCGLLIAAAAALLEVTFELIRGR
jgi:hypothetical protein